MQTKAHIESNMITTNSTSLNPQNYCQMSMLYISTSEQYNFIMQYRQMVQLVKIHLFTIPFSCSPENGPKHFRVHKCIALFTKVIIYESPIIFTTPKTSGEMEDHNGVITQRMRICPCRYHAYPCLQKRKKISTVGKIQTYNHFYSFSLSNYYIFFVGYFLIYILQIIWLFVLYYSHFGVQVLVHRERFRTAIPINHKYIFDF